jgi:hypothetical protein
MAVQKKNSAKKAAKKSRKRIKDDDVKDATPITQEEADLADHLHDGHSRTNGLRDAELDADDDDAEADGALDS